MKVSFTLNGRPVSLDTDPLRRLLDVLREDFELTGTKEGCGEGECGACTVLIGDDVVNSCLVPVGSVEGEEILTIEGFRQTDRYHALADAFAETGAVQCGFCTPGFIMAAEGLLRKRKSPSRDEIRRAVSGNLCRCTGYNMIIEGIQRAAEQGGDLW
jgi:carbon-monoxide dehydrogenase small subunit